MKDNEMMLVLLYIVLALFHAFLSVVMLTDGMWLLGTIGGFAAIFSALAARAIHRGLKT